ncbi:MAG: hypothetical protein KKB25_01080 [Nanoarchaeota archaeon]|nr:hypothetical protein [Nanoarchaeota archaeon]
MKLNTNLLVKNNKHNKHKILKLKNRYIAKGSPYKIALPNTLSNDLIYLIGVIYGDGTIKTRINRQKGGKFAQIVIVGEKKFIQTITPLIFSLFNYKPSIYRDKRKKNCFHICIHSIVIYKFFREVLKMQAGKKAGKLKWLDFISKDKNTLKHFMAGLIDTDGYVGKTYMCIVQKDRKFLAKLKREAEQKLGFKLSGPYINKKIDEKPVAWTIQTHKVKDAISRIPIRYKMPR